jgi:signal transduction histidine kinase
MVALASGVVTLAPLMVPELHFAYRSPTLRSTFCTAAWLIVVLVAFLVFGRVRRGAHLNDLLLTCGLCLLAVSSAFVALLPVFVGHGSRVILDWDGRVYRVVGTFLLAVASVTAPRRLQRPSRASEIALVGVLSVVLLTALAMLLLRNGLTRDVTAVAPPSTSFPDLDAPASILAMSGVAVLLFVVASVGFLHRAQRRGDEFFAWLAAATVLAAFSSLNYLLFPARSTGWVYTGDGFLLMFYAVLLVGAMREISSYWRSAIQVAVLEERRRIARNLHDGLAQEIVYIDRNLRSLEPLEGERGEQLGRLRRAVERAKLESRRGLAVLSSPVDEPLDVVLARAAAEVADRFGAELELDLMSGARASPARAESLVRIACEAVANAALHSGGHRVALTLDHAGEALRLRVRDSGRGFDPAAPTSGFGLISMRERARAVGGRLLVKSAPGRGTTVEAAI